MKIGLRGGHSPNCKGAIGILDEQVEVRKIYNDMVPMLQAAGHTVIDCNSNASTVNGELSDGTNKANSNNCDIYMTLHMNASGGIGNGTEIWLYDAGNNTTNGIADRINKNFESKGFQNRGKKYNTGYHDLNASKMPAMIVEILFCDNQHDVDLYRKLGTKGIAELIVTAITGKPITTSSTPQLKQNLGKSVNMNGIHYRAHCQSVGTLPVARDGQTAGLTGAAKRMEALWIDIRTLRKNFAKNDVKLSAKVHIQSVGWKLYENVEHDTMLGTIGQAKRIEAIELEMTGLPKGKKLYYRTHLAKTGWTPWVQGGFSSGTVGLEKAIEAIQIKVV